MTRTMRFAYRGLVDGYATDVVEAIAGVYPAQKVAIVVFEADDPEAATLYSNAGAADLGPLLKRMGLRIEGGALRMSADALTTRYVEVDVETQDGTKD